MWFSHPESLWALLVLPAVIALGLAAERFARKARAAFTVSSGRSWRGPARVSLQVLGVLFGLLALARPHVLGSRAHRTGELLSVAIGIDVSKSMLAEDVVLEADIGAQQPVSNRLNLARHFAGRLLDEVEGARVGLFLFAKSGVEVVSPTRDHGFLRHILLHTDLADLTVSGSDMTVGLETGIEMLGAVEGAAVKAVVLLTDGEDTEADRPSIIQAAASVPPEVAVFCVGVGTDGGVFIPIRRPGLPVIDGFYANKQGNYLQTRVVAGILQDLSSTRSAPHIIADGFAAQDVARSLGQDLRTRVDETPEVDTRERAWIDASPVLLAAGLLFYAGYVLL